MRRKTKHTHLCGITIPVTSLTDCKPTMVDETSSPEVDTQEQGNVAVAVIGTTVTEVPKEKMDSEEVLADQLEEYKSMVLAEDETRLRCWMRAIAKLW